MPSTKEAKEAVESANALIEMYKAGFMDGYTPKPKTKKDFEILNKKYKKKFMKRFMKKLDKELKGKKK